VPNDLYLDDAAQQILLITGTQTWAANPRISARAALIVLMAQMGSFVPASQRGFR